MNDEKKAALDRVMGLLADSIQEGKEFVLEQAPLVAQEMIAYGRWTGVIATVLLLTGTIACSVGAVKLWKIWAACDYHSADIQLCGSFVGGIILSIASIVCFCNSICFAMETIKAFVAPRLYLLEQVSHLLK